MVELSLLDIRRAVDTAEIWRGLKSKIRKGRKMEEALKTAIESTSQEGLTYPLKWAHDGECSCGEPTCEHQGKQSLTGHDSTKICFQAGSEATLNCEVSNLLEEYSREKLSLVRLRPNSKSPFEKDWTEKTGLTLQQAKEHLE